jgi:2-oxoglutarate ferredoxin oxidoreductase subunit gamma
MTEKILIAGEGGQGIMLLGKVLAEAAMREGKFVTWLPAYGAEVRGGTAYCMVVISSEEIGNPFVQNADTRIIMNQPSFERFGKDVSPAGKRITNSSLVITSSGVEGKPLSLQFPFTDEAVAMGNIKVANMVALGCYIAASKIVKPETVMQVIEDIAPADKKNLIEINRRALLKGIELVSGKG